MATLPDPNKAYALFIGSEHFNDPEYRQLPSCRESVTDLSALSADPAGIMWRVPPHRLKVLGRDDGRVALLDAQAALKDALRSEDLDALLVCVSCHGRRYPNDPELYLAMTDSDSDLPGTHLRFGDIRNLLVRIARNRRVKHVLLIVDACYADGTEVDPGLGGGDATDIDDLEVPGVVVLTATMHQVKAWPHWRDTGRTAFLGALIDSIEAGVPSPRETLTAKNVFDAAAARLAEERRYEPRIPEPNIFRSGRSDIPLCSNAGYVAPLDPKLSANPGPAVVFSSAADCFAEITTAHGSGRDNEIPGIITGLCGRDDVPESEIAGLVSRLETTEFSGYVPRAYNDVCGHLPAASLARLLDSLHHNDVTVDERFTTSLRGRDHAGRVAAEVCWLLLESICDDCHAIADLIADLIIADSGLAPEALAVWQ